MDEEIKFMKGDRVYGVPVKAVRVGVVDDVYRHNKTLHYIVNFKGWGRCARSSRELFKTEKQALKALAKGEL